MVVCLEKRSGGFSPGLGTQTPSFTPAVPSFMVAHDFFAKITHTSYAFVFLKFRKVGKFAASIQCPKTKNASASRGFPPLTP